MSECCLLLFLWGVGSWGGELPIPFLKVGQTNIGRTSVLPDTCHTCRDTFYSLLRDWESCHDDPKWSMKDNLGDKIQLRILIRSLRTHTCNYLFHVS